MTLEKRTTKLENRYDEFKESGGTMGKKILKEFEKEVVDYFWNKETVVGTQRLSSNHIEKIKSFILSALSKQLEEIRDEIDREFVKESKGLERWEYNQGINCGLRRAKKIIESKLKELK
jgi:uncharacterized protein (DUF2164 family)